jgi:hypothetical protein
VRASGAPKIRTEEGAVPEIEPTAVLVILKPGTTEVEAATIRTAMRMWHQVADVRAVSKDNRQAVAEARVHSEVMETLTPIFTELRERIGGALDTATDSFEAITGDEPTPGNVADMPEQRKPSPTSARSATYR